jgi:NAD(P)-dependent dehydrogenase (short-subunit alcohol dehydrogenase family)
MNLDNQIAIVTGGGQGIGQQIALRLAQEGAFIVIADINIEGSRKSAEMILEKYGKRIKVIPTDITQEEQVVHMVKSTLEIDNRIDILVNNSGIAGPTKNIEDISLEEWEETMAVNLRGMFLCCKHVVPVMKKQNRGNIVNIASVTGKRPLTQRSPYGTTKMGVIGFTRTLAVELGTWNIRANAVCPGAVVGCRQALRENVGSVHCHES